jgi:hypothetical protein
MRARKKILDFLGIINKFMRGSGASNHQLSLQAEHLSLNLPVNIDPSPFPCVVDAVLFQNYSLDLKEASDWLGERAEKVCSVKR